MKMKNLALAVGFGLAVGMSSTALAATDGFSDVPRDHWSYDAIQHLAEQGIIDGYTDGSFKGDHEITRYEMAVIIAKAKANLDEKDYMNQALIEKLEREYKDEVARLDAKVDALAEEVNRVKFNGFFRAKYDSDSTGGVGNDGNKHFFMNLEASMKVSDMWTAHLQSETNRNYRHNASDNGGMGTVQRVWLNGSPAKNIDVELGSKWWGFGYQNTIWGHAAAGAKVTAKVADGVSVSAFSLRPNQDQWFNLAQNNRDDYDQVSINGANVTAQLGHCVEAQVTGMKVAGDDVKTTFGMDNAWAVDAKIDLAKNLQLLANYTKTNADEHNNTQGYRLNYKNTDLNDPGSFQLYARYIKFDKYGDLGHDEEWGSLPSNRKGFILGAKYVPWKNVEWETFYSVQKAITGNDEDRKLIRTQLDFHF